MAKPGDTIVVEDNYTGAKSALVTVDLLTFDVSSKMPGIVLTLSGVSDISLTNDGGVTILGSGGDETISAGNGADSINSGGGLDAIYGNGGDDVLNAIGASAGDTISLYGGAGDDTLIASGTAAQELLFGGPDSNTFLFTEPTGVWTNLYIFGTGSADDTLKFQASTDGAHFDLDSVELSGIEKLTFASIGANKDVTVEIDPDEVTVTGTELNNALAVTGNNATGSTEVILIDLSRSPTETTLDLSGWTFTDWGGQGEHVSIIGSVRNDTITGSTSNDMIDGGDGDDTVFEFGGGGTFFSIEGGTGTDLLDLSGSSTSWYIDLTATLGNAASGGALGTVGGFESIYGSALGDTMIAAGDLDLIYGGEGDDTLISAGAAGQTISLYGQGGNDTLIASGTASEDLLFGGSDSNVFLFDDATGTWVNDFLFGGGDDTMLFQAQADGDHFDLDGLELSQIERLTFASIGSNKDVTVEIDPDEVTITGSELKNDLAVTGNNASGSTEVILIDLSRSPTETTLDLSGWTFTDWGGQGEHVSIVGSVRDDTITGTKMNDVITTGGGNDIIYGDEGDDILISTGMAGDSISLYGGDGNDTLIASGTTSQDLLFGGADSNVFLFNDETGTWVNDFLFGGGDDTMLFRAQANGAHFDLNGLELSQIERLTFDRVGPHMDVTVEIGPGELTINGSELSNNLAVTGSNMNGSTEVILIDLSRSGTETTLDLSGWTFTNWGGQGEHVSLVGSSRDDMITATSSDDVIRASGGADAIDLGTGEDVFTGAMADFFGATVTNFALDDRIVIEGFKMPRGQIERSGGTTALNFDTDGNDVSDGTLTFQGDYSGGDFMAVFDGTDTTITFETYLPTLAETVGVGAGSVNGVNNVAFLTGDGTSDFLVSLSAEAMTSSDNVIGVYEITASGVITDVRLLFANANADKTAQALVSDVQDGHQLGFFLIKDAADRIGDGSGTLEFVNGSGATARLSDGADIFIEVNGSVQDEMIFHSFDRSLNADGIDHVLSGVVSGGTAIRIGFEDQFGGGDADYQDVLMQVELA
ncbi:MAG: DUF4114 domain-containing protein [Pseudomonadota bacterium]|nr:DUF4114 domain-containing protein [Pseudomonadota bacterium]